MKEFHIPTLFRVFADEYFDSRMPTVMKRIAHQGGIRLAVYLNRVFGDQEEEFAAATSHYKPT